MGYLTIKQFNKDRIQLYHSRQYYSLGYKLDYMKLSSISIKLNGVSMVENNGYYITIKDKQSIRNLRDLDVYLLKFVPNYKPLLHEGSNEYYIFFKKNDYLDSFMKTLSDNEFIINIIKLKKTASHTFPIVYVL